MAERGQWIVLAAVLLSSLLALVYVGRIVEVGWFREPTEPALSGSGRPAPTMLAMMWVLVAASLLFGVFPGLPGTLAGQAADALLGSGP